MEQEAKPRVREVREGIQVKGISQSPRGGIRAGIEQDTIRVSWGHNTLSPTAQILNLESPLRTWD